MIKGVKGHISNFSSSFNLKVRGSIFITKNFIISPRKFFLSKSYESKLIGKSKKSDFVFIKEFLILLISFLIVFK